MSAPFKYLRETDKYWVIDEIRSYKNPDKYYEIRISKSVLEKHGVHALYCTCIDWGRNKHKHPEGYTCKHLREWFAKNPKGLDGLIKVEVYCAAYDNLDRNGQKSIPRVKIIEDESFNR